MLFSEPKIPQFSPAYYDPAAISTKFQCSSASRKFLNTVSSVSLSTQPKFQCSSASRKFLNSGLAQGLNYAPVTFQCSSASRKFLNCRADQLRDVDAGVSVLFSEPKIPQFVCNDTHRLHIRGFSALQRAENSSIVELSRPSGEAYVFQCSSASRKFLNSVPAF